MSERDILNQRFASSFIRAGYAYKHPLEGKIFLKWKEQGMSERSHFTQVVSQKIHEYLIDVDENKPGSKYEAVVSALCSTARNSNLDLDKIMESVLEKDLSEYQKAFLAATCK